MKNTVLDMKSFLFIFIVLGALTYNYYLSQVNGEFRFLKSIASPQVFSKNKLTERAVELGIDFKQGLVDQSEFKNQSKWVFPVVTTVAAADLNNDGFQDLVFTNLDKSIGAKVYFNNKGKQFISNQVFEKTLNESKISSTYVAIFDFDQDGYKDLVLAGIGCLQFFKNNKGQSLVNVSNQYLQQPYCGISSHIALLDYNNDGLTDMVISNNFSLDPDVYLQVTKKERRVGEKNSLLRNTGRQFVVVKDSALGQGKKWTWLSGLTDVDKDGYTDIFSVNDINTNQFYKNINGKFEEYTGQMFPKQYTANNMSAEFGDLDNDGVQELFISNSSYAKYYPYDENFLYKLDISKKNLIQVSRKLGVDKCGWAWGAKFFDLDNNGFLDLFVTNGFFKSGNKDFMYKISYYGNGSPDLTDFALDYPNPEGYQIGGDEKSCLFYNSGQGFVNIADQFEGLDGYIGRGVSAIDIDNNGTQDLVVSVNNSRPRVYINSAPESGNSWIGFSLVTGFNAFGTRIEIDYEGGQMSREYYPTNGFSSQSESRIHFGLGKFKVKEIRIFWPGRKIQKLKSYKINAYNVIYEEK